jgi:hypothetical protein
MQAINNLLDQSGQQRGRVQPTIQTILNCPDSAILKQATQTLVEVASARQNLLTQLEQVAIDQIPNGEVIISDLRSAWQASEASDQSYAAWGSDVANGQGCGTNDANFQNAQVTDRQATTAKQAFVARWNPLAAQFNLSPRDPATL